MSNSNPCETFLPSDQARQRQEVQKEASSHAGLRGPPFPKGQSREPFAIRGPWERTGSKEEIREQLRLPLLSRGTNPDKGHNQRPFFTEFYNVQLSPEPLAPILT
ncbi:hypothetical protein D623_10033662 [Myotis brandtii]|uniref:Uncharacterized protein n=1 Tax=Myotis brandtii TaxID=109478 RepID=S7NVW5_MYOBR|nr:hypothetical protein D623_10033662 [Myotis brandtii]